MKLLSLLVVLLLTSCVTAPDRVGEQPTEPNNPSTPSLANNETEHADVTEDAEMAVYCQHNPCRQNVLIELQTEAGLLNEQADFYWPVIQGEQISILVGEQVYISGEFKDGVLTDFQLGDASDPGAISFDLKQSDEDIGMMLVVKNPHPFRLKLSIDMIDFEGQLHPTSSCPIMAEGGIFEMWPHPIPELMISNIRVMTDDEPMSCVY